MYGAGTAEEHRALDGITFSIDRGEFVAIVGPSGCGKTTLLRCLSGLMTPTSGSVTLDGVPVDSVPEDLTLVFQDYRRSLYPWLRVDANVEFPLRYSGIDKRERAERVRQALDDVGLTGHGGKYPGQLSGGMQQRVSIARALAYRPHLLLMDEPFASVDAQTPRRWRISCSTCGNGGTRRCCSSRTTSTRACTSPIGSSSCRTPPLG